MQVNEPDLDLAANDLGPLAWVLDELRKSLDSASAALRRFVRDAGQARGTDMASVDGGQLRIARQQLHQAVGALEMVGLPAPAHMLRAMESAVQKFVERPELCSEASASKIERAGFALAQYLEGVLLGKPVSAVALFPQYRDAQELAGGDRVHPADLWEMDWRWIDPEMPAAAESMSYGIEVRARVDHAVLAIVRTGDVAAGRDLSQVCMALALGQSHRQPRVFWKLAAGFFEGIALGLVPVDVYIKRAASRVLMQYASLAKGEQGVSDRLAQDLLFFCCQAVPARVADAPLLSSIRLAWGLARFRPADYQVAQYGRFDPVLLAQARKRIGTAKETWSTLAGGDANKLKTVGDQFHMVSDSLGKLHPQSGPLARALNGAVDGLVRAAHPPSPELAMEVATAILYLEAAFEDLDPTDAQLEVRTARLAERLDSVRQGGKPEPLESWMEELYRRVSDRQTMGSVVGELRTALSDLEKELDIFFRNPHDKTPLQGAPGRLSQMRGVLSVLGLDQASQAVLRMREAVEQIMVADPAGEPEPVAGTFEKLGNNLGALGFLIDMLNYQPALAKKLFVYDDALGELKPLMGRSSHSARDVAASALSVHDEAPVSGLSALDTQVLAAVPATTQLADDDRTVRLDAAATQAMLADMKLPAHEQTMPVPVQAQTEPSVAFVAASPEVPVAPIAAQADAEEDDFDLREIFLDEAREVVQNGLVAIDALAASPNDMSELTTLRRAFHTLKGSSRMVGLNEFGDAAWSMEQVLNTVLADQKPSSDGLLALSGDAMRGFARWVEDIAQQNDGEWKSGMFRTPADTFRTEQRVLALVLPGAADTPLATDAPATPVDLQSDAFGDTSFFEVPATELGALDAPAQASEISFDVTHVIRGRPVEVAEIPLEELPQEFVFELSADAASAVPVEVGTTDIDSIDFSGLAAAAETSGTDLPLEAVSEPAPLGDSPAVDEQVKVIGSLRIGIPLYNVYLNEADEWSRRLVTEVTEWALELNQQVPDSAVGLAHALAGSSATVGFHALSDIARALEGSLQHAQSLVSGTPEHGRVFTEAAEEIRRLLHQFAAGFLKDPDPRIMPALLALKEIDGPQRADLPEPEPMASDFASLRDADAEAAQPAPVIEAETETETEAEPEPEAEPTASAVEPQPEVAPEWGTESEPEPASTAEALADPVAPAPSWAAPAWAPAPPAAFVAPVRQASLEDEQDDLDVADAIDVDLFPIFEEEAIELMPQLGGALRQWAARPDNRGARDEVLRALHTLKGSARLAGALRLGELAHRLESEIEYLGSENVNAADIEPLLHRFDNMQGNFDTLRATGGQAPLAPLEALDAPVGMAFDAVDSPAPAELAANDTPTGGDALAPQVDDAAAYRPQLARPAAMLQAPQRASANQAVRVRSQLLDRLVNQAGEVIITRSRLEAELGQLRGSLSDLTGNLDRLRSQLRDIELQAESQMQSRLAQAKDSAANFDPLEFDRFTRVQELTRMMAESVNDVATVQRNLQRTVEATEDDLIAQARQTRELQRDLLRTRMVEFEGISDRLYRVVRQASKETGKQVKLDITGGSIEMDRGMLDRMTPAFEHLLRNCVAHGIELPETRSAAGKEPAGTILIGLHHEGNDVSVEFRDDGAGLDLARIRDKARQQGLIGPAQDISDGDAANLIFMPGFSTATHVTEISGRGIGMDVVRSEVNALGGRIETSTQAGQGTNFKLVLPLTTAVTQVVMIRAGAHAIGVPATMVEVVRRIPAADVEKAYQSGFYEVGSEKMPFFWSGALLQASQRSSEPESRTLPVVVFRSAAQRIAVHVDEVLGNQEVVVKNLGPQLSRLPGLAGMTVLASGAVVLIYNPVALTAVYGEQARRLSLEQEAATQGGDFTGVPALAAAPQQVPLVLVVDDSITVRRVTQRLLQREGYRVSLAADGLQALEKLAEEKPTVVLSDIEMPRMDGFDLARNIRADARLADLPIIMITSRIAGKHREHAMELGVNNYLGKPYSEEELLSLVKHYCDLAVSI